MYQEISLRLNDGSEQKFPFLATGGPQHTTISRPSIRTL